MNINRGRKGFTLLEMLLVIAIIAILASIVIVAINPAKQLGDANNAKRHSDVLAILNAIHQYSIDNSGDISDLNIQTSDDASDECALSQGDAWRVCSYGESSCTGTDLDILVGDPDNNEPSYLTDIPVDPQITLSDDDDDVTGYYVVQDTENSRVTVCAPLTENIGVDAFSDMISVTR